MGVNFDFGEARVGRCKPGVSNVRNLPGIGKKMNHRKGGNPTGFIEKDLDRKAWGEQSH